MISSVQGYLQDYISTVKTETQHQKSLPLASPIYLDHRESVMNWLFDYGEQLSVESHCIQQACLLMDVFISSRNIDTFEVYQLIAGLCLNITTKLESQISINVLEMPVLMGLSLSPTVMSQIEILILDTVRWKVVRPTAAGMSRLMLQMVCPEYNFEMLWKYSDAFAALCYCNSELAHTDPITLAVATVCAALDKLKQYDFKAGWLSHIQAYFSPTEVEALLSRIQKLISQLGDDGSSDSTDTPQAI